MVYLDHLIIYTYISFPSSLPSILFKDLVGGELILLGNSKTAG